MEHTSERDFAAFVQKNHEYYLKQFRKFNEGGTDRFRFTWNWAAFLLPCIWPAYRRMYGWALLAPVLFVIMIWVILGNESSPILLLGSHILPGLFLGMTGNYLYYKKIRSAMSWRGRRISSWDKCGVTIRGAINAPLIFWTILALYFAVALPGYFSYSERGYDAAALSDLRNAGTMLNAIYNDHQSYASVTLRSSSGVTTLDCGVDTSYNKVLSSRGVELKLLAVDQDCYLISSQHEKGRHIYLTGQDANGIVRVLLPTTGKAIISRIERADVEKLPENDGKAYKALQDARQVISRIARKDRNAKVDGETFNDPVREQAVMLDLPYANGTASSFTLFTRHNKGSIIFLTGVCGDKVFGIHLQSEAGGVRIYNVE